MGIVRRRFKMVGIRDMQNYPSDHFKLRDRLVNNLMRCHRSYLQGRCAFALSLLAPEDFRPVGKQFQELKAL